MRVGIIAPHYHHEKRGNAVTVRRIERYLRLLGCEVTVFPVELAGEALLAKAKEFAPQLLHAFHGYLGGRMAHAIGEKLAVPYLVTLTGSDVYESLTDQRSHDTHSALKGAARLVAFHAVIKRRLAEHLPSLEERTVIIPQGVELPPEPAPRAPAADTFTFLLPAGLRPVKNVLFPLEPLAALQESYPGVRFEVAGPVVETGYAAEVLDALEQRPFARYLGEVAHDSMGSLYRAADVVLNSSLFEGGMSNSVLEALAYGKAVLASDVEGNRSVIKECVTGLLYRDELEFRAKAERLMSDPQLLEHLGRNGRELVRDKHSPEKEAQAYLQLYRAILG